MIVRALAEIECDSENCYWHIYAPMVENDDGYWPPKEEDINACGWTVKWGEDKYGEEPPKYYCPKHS